MSRDSHQTYKHVDTSLTRVTSNLLTHISRATYCSPCDSRTSEEPADVLRRRPLYLRISQ